MWGFRKPERRICEVKYAVGAIDEIVRTIEPFALITIRQHRNLAIILQPTDAVITVLVDCQSPLQVERQSVRTRLAVLCDVGIGVSAGRAKHFELASVVAIRSKPVVLDWGPVISEII